MTKPPEDKGYFSQIPIILFDEYADKMSEASFVAFLRLYRHYGYKGEFAGSIRKLVKVLHMPRTTLHRAIKKWAEVGLIEKGSHAKEDENRDEMVIVLRTAAIWQQNKDYSNALKECPKSGQSEGIVVPNRDTIVPEIDNSVPNRDESVPNWHHFVPTVSTKTPPYITKIDSDITDKKEESNTTSTENQTIVPTLSRGTAHSLQENENGSHHKTQEFIEKLREWRIEDAQEEDTPPEIGDTNAHHATHPRSSRLPDSSTVLGTQDHSGQGEDRDQKTQKNRDGSAVNPPVERVSGRTTKGEEASTAPQNLSASSLPVLSAAEVGDVAASDEVPPPSPTKPSRKPSKSKVDEARVDAVFDCMDAAIRELTNNPDWHYTRPKTDRKIITDFITNREIKAAQLRAVMSAMYNTPKDERTGFSWRENMSVKAIFNNYDKFCITLHSKQNGKTAPSNIYGNLQKFDVSLFA